MPGETQIVGGEAGEGAVGVDRALETGNSAIYAEYIREMALP